MAIMSPHDKEKLRRKLAELRALTLAGRADPASPNEVALSNALELVTDLLIDLLNQPKPFESRDVGPMG